MIQWKKYRDKDIDGNPLEIGGMLDLEGPSVFEKIAVMPKGKPITPHQLDVQMIEDIQKAEGGIGAWIVNLGPIAWCVFRGYHIVYSSADYEIIGES